MTATIMTTAIWQRHQQDAIAINHWWGDKQKGKSTPLCGKPHFGYVHVVEEYVPHIRLIKNDKLKNCSKVNSKLADTDYICKAYESLQCQKSAKNAPPPKKNQTPRKTKRILHSLKCSKKVHSTSPSNMGYSKEIFKEFFQ